VAYSALKPIDKLRDHYMGYLYSLFRKTVGENRQVILRMLEPCSTARLLDLGCNDGEWTLRLAECLKTSEISGVEVSPVHAQKARSRGVKVVEANLNGKIPLPDAAFDVVHANQVIEHLYNTDMFATEIKRLLAPGGYAIISTNNLASLHNIASLAFGCQPPPCNVSNRIVIGNNIDPMNGMAIEDQAMSHLRIFSYRALRDFFGVYGLKPDVYRTVGFYPFPLPIARVLTAVLPVYGAFITCRLRHK
jgi:SAM-dependent methyltransferase